MNKPMKVKNPFSAESKIERLGKKEQKAKNKKTSVAARSVMKQQLKISKAKNKMNSVRDAYSNKPNNYVSAAQRKAVHASKKDGGKGNPNNKPKSTTIRFIDKKRDKYVVGNELTKTTKRKKKIKTVTKKRAAKITRKNLK